MHGSTVINNNDVHKKGVPASNGHSSTQSNNNNLEEKYVKETSLHCPIQVWTPLVIFVVCVFMFIHVHLIYSFPSVVSRDDKLYDKKFSEEKARKHLDTFTGFGPRVGGSQANENLSWKYIIDEINSIKANALPPQEIILDLQTVSGSFHLDNIINTNFYSVYNGLKNIVVKLTSESTKADSLLVSCHYDTVTGSPGEISQERHFCHINYKK